MSVSHKFEGPSLTTWTSTCNSLQVNPYIGLAQQNQSTIFQPICQVCKLLRMQRGKKSAKGMYEKGKYVFLDF